jgi:hypothetical protein
MPAPHSLDHPQDLSTDRLLPFCDGCSERLGLEHGGVFPLAWAVGPNDGGWKAFGPCGEALCTEEHLVAVYQGDSKHAAYRAALDQVLARLVDSDEWGYTLMGWLDQLREIIGVESHDIDDVVEAVDELQQELRNKVELSDEEAATLDDAANVLDRGWDNLANEGLCDSRAGMEYARLLSTLRELAKRRRHD